MRSSELLLGDVIDYFPGQGPENAFWVVIGLWQPIDDRETIFLHFLRWIDGGVWGVLVSESTVTYHDAGMYRVVSPNVSLIPFELYEWMDAV